VTTACGGLPSVTTQKLKEDGQNAATVTFYDIAGQGTSCNQLLDAGTCIANKKCAWDATQTTNKCAASPYYTIVALANACPSEAAKVETFANAGGLTVAGLATVGRCTFNS
jgi:hypothetical protein